jgi:spore coat protein U-like protein
MNMTPIRIMKTDRRTASMLILLACCIWASVQTAQAITCSLSSPGWAVTYDPNSALATTTSSTVSVTCTRQTGDGKNFTLSLGANSGNQPLGTINQAVLTGGSALLQYNNYSDAAYTLAWGTGGSTFSVAISFTGGPGSTASPAAAPTFYAKIPAGQTSVPPGSYTDTVLMTLYNGATAVSVATSISPSVTINPYCAFSTAPGTIAFNYTSFQASTVTANTSFAVLCSNTLPYSFSLDATSGTLLGLNYTLAAPGGTYSGTGSPQSYTINGSIAGSQAGTCAAATCTGSATHILTITY